jgi:hypothetical protein
MGVSVDRIKQLTSEGISSVDKSERYSLVDANKAYLRFKLKEYRNKQAYKRN